MNLKPPNYLLKIPASKFYDHFNLANSKSFLTMLLKNNFPAAATAITNFSNNIQIKLTKLTFNKPLSSFPQIKFPHCKLPFPFPKPKKPKTEIIDFQRKPVTENSLR